MLSVFTGNEIKQHMYKYVAYKFEIVHSGTIKKQIMKFRSWLWGNQRKWRKMANKKYELI
jgi:hypothetical protein